MKNFFKRYLLPLATMYAIFFGAFTAQAQSLKIEGYVFDESNEPLIGASVLIDGSTTGTVTDVEGYYNLSAPGDATLIVSYIGYDDQMVNVNNRTKIDITLVAGATQIEEMVVIGYGVQKKETLTGSIDVVKADVFQDNPVANPALALQGQTPGLVITRTSSRPGAEGIDMSIRGATSVNGGSPLIIIDGVPITDTESFYSMNPNDIASISVLKDASAAIYGSRAANGVILVTTKVGNGAPKVEFSSSFTINTLGIRPPTSSMSEYATVWLEAAEQDGDQATYWYWSTKENLELMQSGYEGIYTLSSTLGDIYLGDSSRYDEMYGNSISNAQSMSISGSSDRSSYRFSLGYDENVGVLQTTYDGSMKYNVRGNYNFDVTDWLRFESGLSYYNRKDSGPASGLSSESISLDPPLFPSVNPYGEWYANFGVSGGENAVAETTDGGRENTTYDEVKANMNAIIDITKDFKINASASITNNYQQYQKYVLTVPTYTWDGQLANNMINTTSYIRESFYRSVYQNYGVFANYTKDIEDHSFSAMAGINAERKDSKELTAYRADFEDNGVYDLNLGSEESNVTTDGGASNWGFYSVVARVNYNYKSRYLLEVNARRDGSSKFHTDYRWSNFGGVSAGWIITEEKFMKSLDFLNFFKVRASYGEMGNQSGIGNYDYYSTIGYGTAIFGSTAANQTSSSLNSMTSYTRTWERVKTATIGFDFTMLDNRLSGSFDAFNKVNDNMLISITYPDVLGATAPASNDGTLETKGWEVSLAWRDTIGEVTYSVGFNIGDSVNKLTEMSGAESWSSGLVDYREGYPLNSYFLYQTDGFFSSQDDVDAYYAAYGGSGEIPSQTDSTEALRPGDTKKVDIDGNGEINATGGNGGDLYYAGDADPHYAYGINLGASYKGFDFNAMFQGVLQQNVMRIGYLAYPFYMSYTNQTSAFIGQTWTAENPDAAYPRMTANTTRSSWNWRYNDFMLQNNRYIRLKSLVLGYTFSELSILNSLNLEKLRFYFSGNDLFEFTSIKDGFDPEYGESSNASYPFTRTFTFGVNVTF
ncbi:MAG: TonB-dependent receptor [Rikenellaceae bacterium]